LVLATRGGQLQLKFKYDYMTQNEFIEKVKDILLIEDKVDTEFPVKIDSLASLLLIGFYDENFDFKLSADNLKSINTIGDLLNLVKERLD